MPALVEADPGLKRGDVDGDGYGSEMTRWLIG
jgi:hypothetical protein